MSKGWKIWIGVLAVISVILAISGLDYYHKEWRMDNAFASGAPQQTVVAVWHTNGLLTLLVLEVMLLTLVAVSYAFSKKPARIREVDPLREATTPEPDHQPQ
jgi:hypothetical protein